MVQLWRISNHRTLNGRGGLRFGGRWHSAGRPVVYLAESPAGAMLETLVHLMVEPEDIPDRYTLLRVETASLAAAEELPAELDWRANVQRTMELGNEWLRAGRSALARVPSALMPYTFNYLLNPLHGDAAALRIAEIIEDRFDRRLVNKPGT